MNRTDASFIMGAKGLSLCPQCKDIFRPNEIMRVCDPCAKENMGAVRNRTLEVK